MNKLQKMAWYQLIVIVATLSATVAAWQSITSPIQYSWRNKENE